MNRSVTFVVFAALIAWAPRAPAVLIAHDAADDAAYSDGWSEGDNGGFGFEPWSFLVSNNDGVTHFIDRGPLPENGLGAPAFAVTAAYGLPYQERADRGFAPLAPGAVFEMDVGGVVLDPGTFSGSGLVLSFADRTGIDFTDELGLGVDPNLFGGNWFFSNASSFPGVLDDTGIPASSSFHVLLANSTTAPGIFAVVLTPLSGGAPLFTSAGLASEIDMLSIDMFGAGPLFFDNLQISMIPETSSAAMAVVAGTFLLRRRRPPSGKWRHGRKTRS
jgi:hypothetical protein